MASEEIDEIIIQGQEWIYIKFDGRVKLIPKPKDEKKKDIAKDIIG